MKENYVSPKMDFEEVMVDNAVAETCWGHHGKNKTLYADFGTGYYSFQIGGSSCAMTLINVTYYSHKGADGIDASPDQIAALESYLGAHGGNEGEPFTGEHDVIITKPDDPRLS